MLLQLTPDVQEMVLFYCNRADLKKLSLCSHASKDITQELLWHRVAIPFNQLEKNFLEDRIIEGFRETKILVLGHEFGKFYPLMRSSNNFRVALQHCNPTTVVTGFLPNDAFDVFGTLDILTELYLTSFNATDYSLGIIYRKLSGLKLLSLKGSIITHKGLKDIGCMKKLESLDISSCARLTDEAMMHIADVKSLKHLNLSSCWSLTQEGMKKVQSLTLISLDVSNCHQINDMCLSVIGTMMSLEHLNLSMCVGFTDVGLKELQGLLHLKSLDVSCCSGATDMAFLNFPLHCKITRS